MDIWSIFSRLQQDKHVRKLEALQVQLRRYEEETENLNRVLEEQRGGIEERDRLIRQMRSEGVSIYHIFKQILR